MWLAPSRLATTSPILGDSSIFQAFFSYSNTMASSRHSSFVPVCLSVVLLDGEEREMEDMGPTSKSVNVHVHVDGPLRLLYSM